MTKIAIVGCGYVSDFYLNTLKDYPDLEVAGLYDRNPERSQMMSRHYGHPVYKDLDSLLSDPEVSIVVNLTNPRSHYEISRAALESGKHVYSEKPLATEFDKAKELYHLAAVSKLKISSAPCSLLGEQAQTVWKALRDDMIGDVWMVYAELDEGPIHLMEPDKWRSASGIPWPVNDEFEVGSTMEHAGYYLTWLVAFFGPATHVSAFSSCRIPDKKTAVNLNPPDTPDFSVATIKFRNGVVARLTCSIMGEHNHDLKIFGEKGVLTLDECWNYGNPIRYQFYNKRAMDGQKYPYVRNNPLLSRLYGIRWKKLPFVRKPDKRAGWNGRRPALYYMDYARGVFELAEAINENRPSRLSPELALHINELSLAIQYAGEQGKTYEMQTDCGTIEPMDWSE